MKAFYGVVIASLLLLAAVPLSQPIYSNNAYFNGPVKKVQQRIYGLNGHEVSDRYAPSGLGFSYCSPSMDNPELPTEKLLLEAFDMHFDAAGELIARKRYDGEGDDLALQVKTVWDSLGEYEQIKRKIDRDYSVSYDSVLRQYNPETHILRQYHWHRAADSAWRPLPLGSDSILQVGDFAVLHFDRFKLIYTEYLNSLPDGIVGRLAVIQAWDDSLQVDTILYQYKGAQIWRFTQFNATDGYLVKYDEQDRKEAIIRTSYKVDKESTIVRTVFNYDRLGSDYFIERIHRDFSARKGDIEDEKTHYYFDQWGRLSRSELVRYETLDTEILVSSNRLSYSADSTLIRQEFLLGDSLLVRSEESKFDHYGNPISVENIIFRHTGDTATQLSVRLTNLEYDEYGNWLKATYNFRDEDYFRLERRFEYY